MVEGLRPLADSENETLALPEPNTVPPLAGRRVPKLSLQLPGSVAPKRNQPVVSSPRGFAVPLSWAPLSVSIDAGSVVTSGGAAGVVNDNTEPNDVPSALETIAQK